MQLLRVYNSLTGTTRFYRDGLRISAEHYELLCLQHRRDCFQTRIAGHLVRHYSCLRHRLTH